MTIKITDIAVSKISPDPNQPRKYFNAEKMKTLTASIKQYGIKQPLIVQEVGKDNYLISVGERRYRAASQLGLKEIPCIVEKPQSETERLVEQFNVEEQHEGWTPVEKAVAITTLSANMGLTLKETCKLLNVTETDTSRYTAFSALVDKATWVKNEVPLDYAAGIASLKAATRRISEGALEVPFTRADEKKMEHKIIEHIKDGGIARRPDLTKLKDAFKKDPKAIDKFMNTKVTPAALYLSTKAQGAHYLRNAVVNAGWAQSHATKFLALKDVKITDTQLGIVKAAIATLKELVATAE